MVIERTIIWSRSPATSGRLQCTGELNWRPLNTNLSVRGPVQQRHVNCSDKNEGDVALLKIILPDCNRTQSVWCHMVFISFQVIDAGHFWAQKPESESARGLQMLQERINNNEGRNLRVRRMINLLSVFKADTCFLLPHIAFWLWPEKRSFIIYVTLTTVSIISVTLRMSRHSGLIQSHLHAIC